MRCAGFITSCCALYVSCDDAEDDEQLTFDTSEEVEVVKEFSAMGLKDDLLRGIYAFGTYVAECSPHVCLFDCLFVCFEVVQHVCVCD